MKKLFMFLMALLLPLFALEMSADDENAKMKIPLEVKPKTKLNRSLVEENVICYYYGVTNVIVTNVSPNLGDVTLTITNTSTGEVWYDVFDSGTDPQTVLPISGTPGFYEITYITSSGDVYEGSFTIQ